MTGKVPKHLHGVLHKPQLSGACLPDIYALRNTMTWLSSDSLRISICLQPQSTFFAHSAVFVDNKASSFSPKVMFAQPLTQLVVVTLGQLFICVLTTSYLRRVTRQQFFELEFFIVEFL